MPAAVLLAVEQAVVLLAVEQAAAVVVETIRATAAARMAAM